MELLTNFLLVAGIVTNIFLIFKVIRKSKLSVPYKLLGTVFVLSLIILVNFYAHLHELKWLYLATFVVEDGSRFLIGTLLFLYVKSLFHKNHYSFFGTYWVHFLPYILYLIFISVPLALTMANLGYGFKYLSFLEGTQNFTLAKDIFFIGYLVASIIIFKNFKTKMKNNYSSITSRDFSWIGHMLSGSLSIIIIDLVFSLYQFLNGRFTFDSGYISAICVVFLLGHLVYYGTGQSSIFLPEFVIETENLRGNKNNIDDYLTPNERTWYTEKLKKAMKESHLYLNEDLTLVQLANKIGLTGKKLSVLLNRHLNTSFYDFINHYRIEEVKSKMNNVKYQKYSFLGIAHLSGFKSKSSFYRSFKKNTGVLPKTYRETIKRSPSASNETNESA